MSRWVLGALLVLCAVATPAQPAPEPVTEASVAALEEMVAAQADLDEQGRAELQVQLKTARDWLGKEAAYSQRRTDLQLAMDSAAQTVERFRQQLAEAEAKPVDQEQAVDPGLGPEQLEGQIALLRAERTTLDERRSVLLRELEELPARRTEVQERLVAVRGELQANRTGLELAVDGLVQEVAQLAARARQQALTAELGSLELEVLSEPARSDTSSAERAWLQRAIADVDLRLTALGQAAEAARAEAVQEKVQAVEDLQAELENRDPRLREFADGNRALAEHIQLTDGQAEIARTEGAEMRGQLEYIEEDSALMRRRLEAAGRKEVLGRVMISRLDTLPDTNLIARGIKTRNDRIAETSIAYLDVEEEFRQVSNRAQYLEGRGMAPAAESGELVELVNRLFKQRRQLLESNLQSLGGLQRELLDNNEVAQELIHATGNFHQFLMGNLIWVRDFSFVNLETLYQQVVALLSPADWAQLPHNLRSGYAQEPWGLLMLLVFLVVIVLSWRLRAPYDALMSQPTPLSAETLWSMLLGLGMSLLQVAPWPLALLLTGHFLDVAEPKTPFLAALAPALMSGANVLYALLFIRRMINRLGVGRRHLKWDARMLDAVRSELGWAGPTLVLLGIVDIFAFNLDVVASGGPLGALATAVLAATIVTVAYRLLRQPIFYEDGVARWSLRLIIAVGLAVFAMQLLGLQFAAEIFLVSLVRSIAFLFLIKVVFDLVARWLLILRARLARKSREESRSPEDAGEDPAEDLDDTPDLESLSEAHRSLLFLGRFLALAMVMWWIWSPSLPALDLFESITLWQVADSADPTGGLRAISLADLGLGLIILVITVLVAKHLPSLLQVLLLEWLSISAGARYAFGMLLQYVVYAIGASLFLGTVGWEWSKLQWLVAALGVGIGFGLQEIVANFISGIIILFERPVRVGDIITVAGAEGTVKEIKPRATVLETFEKKEILVPNKELITGQVVNWTLSDSAVRVLIPVGIAYGSDVRLARRLLLEAAGEVETVLQEPEPRATFDDFGDNALLMVLRCYVSEQRMETWTRLRELVNDKFAAAGIEISFPQRDVHLDASGPLRIEIAKPGGAVPAGGDSS